MRNSRQSSLQSWRAASAGMLAVALWALAGTASAQIAGTKHNLGSGAGPAGRNQVTNTADICVFCHTPHGGDTTAPVPLWNKRLGVGGVPAGGGTYITYASLQTRSLDGTEAPVGSISVACLSCHDGTQAMDNIINAPGSGGYAAAGGGIDGLAYTWSIGTRANVAGQMINVGEFIPNLGTDLSNDHPIGIQYCGGGLGAAGEITACRDQDFRPASTATINANVVFWIDTGAAGKQRTDLPLYTRSAGGLGPLVECGSCHDPHVAADQAGPAGTGRIAGATFLRISNAGSAVCTTCHVK